MGDSFCCCCCCCLLGHSTSSLSSEFIDGSYRYNGSQPAKANCSFQNRNIYTICQVWAGTNLRSYIIQIYADGFTAQLSENKSCFLSASQAFVLAKHLEWQPGNSVTETETETQTTVRQSSQLTLSSSSSAAAAAAVDNVPVLKPSYIYVYCFYIVYIATYLWDAHIFCSSASHLAVGSLAATPPQLRPCWNLCDRIAAVWIFNFSQMFFYFFLILYFIYFVVVFYINFGN